MPALLSPLSAECPPDFENMYKNTGAEFSQLHYLIEVMRPHVWPETLELFVNALKKLETRFQPSDDMIRLADALQCDVENIDAAVAAFVNALPTMGVQNPDRVIAEAVIQTTRANFKRLLSAQCDLHQLFGPMVDAAFEYKRLKFSLGRKHSQLNRSHARTGTSIPTLLPSSEYEDLPKKEHYMDCYLLLFRLLSEYKRCHDEALMNADGMADSLRRSEWTYDSLATDFPHQRDNATTAILDKTIDMLLKHFRRIQTSTNLNLVDEYGSIKRETAQLWIDKLRTSLMGYIESLNAQAQACLTTDYSHKEVDVNAAKRLMERQAEFLVAVISD